MSAGLVARAWKRQSGNGNGDGGGVLDGGDWTDYGDMSDGEVSWWWTPAGMAVRYAIVAGVFAFILLFCLGGYWHARRRLRKGLLPLAYHRWTVQRHMAAAARAQQHAEHRVSSGAGDGYVMEHYPPPPPAYNAADAPPPVYQPPEGTSKIAAEQSGTVYVQPLPPTPREDEAAGARHAGGERA